MKLKAMQIGLKGFTNPENMDQVDENKNVWIAFPEGYSYPKNDNVIEETELPDDFAAPNTGIDFFLPQDEEAYLKRINDFTCKYED